jgi:hypothetical protein
MPTTPSATLALDEETFVRLEKLSRKAANDSLGSHGAHLAEDQFDSLAVHLLSLGVRAWKRYDVELAGGVSQETHAFRAMRGYRQGLFTDGPYVDWLRTHVRDLRFEPKGSISVTELGELPESVALEAAEIETVIAHYALGLAEREAWTLRHVATALAGGYTLTRVVEGLLSDLADALAPQLPDETRSRLTSSLESFEQLFTDWLQEAA